MTYNNVQAKLFKAECLRFKIGLYNELIFSFITHQMISLLFSISTRSFHSPLSFPNFLRTPTILKPFF